MREGNKKWRGEEKEGERSLDFRGSGKIGMEIWDARFRRLDCYLLALDTLLFNFPLKPS